jgi:HEPN domain-containing protein
MHLDTKNKTDYWLDIAHYDLITAKAVLEKRRFLYVGFLCHQTIEKCLKAYFWHTKKQEPPLTHNLILLSKQSGFDVYSKDKYMELFKELMPLNIQARYPEDKKLLLKSLNAAKCRGLLKETAKLYKWIKKLSQ